MSITTVRNNVASFKTEIKAQYDLDGPENKHHKKLFAVLTSITKELGALDDRIDDVERQLRQLRR